MAKPVDVKAVKAEIKELSKEYATNEKAANLMVKNHDKAIMQFEKQQEKLQAKIQKLQEKLPVE